MTEIRTYYKVFKKLNKAYTTYTDAVAAMSIRNLARDFFEVSELLATANKAAKVIAKIHASAGFTKEGENAILLTWLSFEDTFVRNCILHDIDFTTEETTEEDTPEESAE